MQTKSIYIENIPISYPVGNDMQRAYEYAQAARTAFKSIDEFTDRKLVNLWCRSSSGAIMAALFAEASFEYRICHVKKEGEMSHGSAEPFSTDFNPIEVIIDDFISTGFTINAIYEEMKSYRRDTVDVLIVLKASLEYLDFLPNYLITNPEYKKENEQFLSKQQFKDHQYK